MPTENESLVPIVRDINVLLNLDTYQDMSDDEIEIVINYKIDCAIARYDINRNKTAIEEASQAIKDYYTTAVQNSNTMLQLALEREIPWATVAQDGTVIQNV